VNHKSWVSVLAVASIGAFPLAPATADTAGGDPVLLAAGDVAKCDSPGDEATAALVESRLENPAGHVAMLGDGAYPDGDLAHYQECYDPSWGRFKARTRPALGNHEYDFSPNGAPYFQYFGANAGAVGKGYYSYELGGWHIVVLNSNCSAVGGCGVGSPEYQWLQQDLAASPNDCTLAYWHHPMFASSDLSTGSVKPFWDLLYQAGADVIVNAHARQYERFMPMTPDGTVDYTTGIREFVVGTGGANLTRRVRVADHSEIWTRDYHGLLELTLRPGRYHWRFVAAETQRVIDSGSGRCH